MSTPNPLMVTFSLHATSDTQPGPGAGNAAASVSLQLAWVLRAGAASRAHFSAAIAWSHLVDDHAQQQRGQVIRDMARGHVDARYLTGPGV